MSDAVKGRLRELLAEDPGRVHVLMRRLDSYLKLSEQPASPELDAELDMGPLTGQCSKRTMVDQLVFSYYAMLIEAAPRLITETFDRKRINKLETFLGHIEIVRDGVLEVVLFPAPQSVRLATSDINVRDALRDLKQDPTISRDFHANKLRDFVRQSDKVLSVIKCQNQLRLLSLNTTNGACCVAGVGISCACVCGWVCVCMCVLVFPADSLLHTMKLSTPRSCCSLCCCTFDGAPCNVVSRTTP